MVANRRLNANVSLNKYMEALNDLLQLWENLLVLEVQNPGAHTVQIDRLELATDNVKENIVNLIEGMQPDEPNGNL